MRPSRCSTSRMRRSVRSRARGSGMIVPYSTASGSRYCRIQRASGNIAILLPYPRRKLPAMENTPRRVEHQVTDKGYVPVYTTAVVEQPWDRYTREEHAVWATLFDRQRKLLVGRACDEFLENQARFGMSAH